MDAVQRIRGLSSWLRFGCATFAVLVLIVSAMSVVLFGAWAYNAIDDKMTRLERQLDRAQDQFDRALDNNDRALTTYDEVLDDIDTNRREINQQLKRVIERNEDSLRLYRELLIKANEAADEAEQLPADLRDFRIEVARLAVETQRLNMEIVSVQNDVRALGRGINTIAEDIEDFRSVLRQVLDAIGSAP